MLYFIMPALKVLKKPFSYMQKYVRAHGQVTPTNLILFVTSRCNARCGHCFYWENINKPETAMTLDKIEKVADSLEPMFCLILTGGETFVREDLVEICKIFSPKTELIHIATNGYYTDRIIEFSKKIKEFHPNLTIQVSIDGLEDKHNEIRGIKLYKQAIETIKQLHANGIDVSVITVVSDKNFDQLEDIAKTITPIGVKLSFELLRRGSKDDYKLPPLDEVYKKIVYIYDNYANVNMSATMAYLGLEIETLKQKRQIIPCLAGQAVGVIYPTGDVAMCELTATVGNLEEYDFDFRKLWYNVKSKQRRKEIEGKIPGKECYCSHSCFAIPSILYSPGGIKTLVFGRWLK